MNSLCGAVAVTGSAATRYVPSADGSFRASAEAESAVPCSSSSSDIWHSDFQSRFSPANCHSDRCVPASYQRPVDPCQASLFAQDRQRVEQPQADRLAGHGHAHRVDDLADLDPFGCRRTRASQSLPRAPRRTARPRPGASRNFASSSAAPGLRSALSKAFSSYGNWSSATKKSV